MDKYDFLIVGAGLFGGTFARLATDAGYKCLVIDKRERIGGNLACDDIRGIQVHKYGPHIFHTNNKEVWDFVNRFSEFNRYTNTPIANNNGNIYNLPFNMNTFSRLFSVSTPKEAMSVIGKEIDEAKNKIGHEPENLEEQALTLVGETIYEALIKSYTEKQWGRECKELPADIIKRLPVRFSYDNNYFNALYQGIPSGGGYNNFINNLFSRIEVRCCEDFNEKRQEYSDMSKMIIYTGRIDSFFDYMYGKLEYRSVYWETETLNEDNHQGVSIVNYTGKEVPFTRVIEHKFFNYPVDFNNEYTVLSKEFSIETNNDNEPFYPINNKKNMELYEKYKKESELYENIFFGGRLGEYKYYDMDKTIESAMDLFNKLNYKGWK